MDRSARQVRRELRRSQRQRGAQPVAGDPTLRELAGRKWRWSAHDVACYKHLCQHYGDVATAVGYVPADRRKVCVQAGGNFGVWPWLLAAYFDEVYTFEPEPQCYAALLENVADKPNVKARNAGLAEGFTFGAMAMKGNNHGAQHIKFGEGPVTCIPLDSLMLPALDLLDLDIEGAEASALEGARETIRAYKPVVIVENWTKRGHPGNHAVNYGNVQSGSDWLREHGYKLAGRIAEDDVFVPV